MDPDLVFLGVILGTLIYIGVYGSKKSVSLVVLQVVPFFGLYVSKPVTERLYYPIRNRMVTGSTPVIGFPQNPHPATVLAPVTKSVAGVFRY
jgi:hypothetical protein